MSGKVIAWAEVYDIIIGSIWFRHNPLRLRSWKSKGDKVHNQPDYLLISNRSISSLLSTKSRPRAACYCGHIPVIGKMILIFKTIKKTHQNCMLDTAFLKTDKEVRERNNVIVQNSFNAIEVLQTTDKQLLHIAMALSVSGSLLSQ